MVKKHKKPVSPGNRPQQCSRCKKTLGNLAGLKSHQRYCTAPVPNVPPMGKGTPGGRIPELVKGFVWDRLMEAALLDLYYDDAAAYAGLSTDCLRTYFRRGEVDLEAGSKTMYSAFAVEYRKRESQGRAGRLGAITRAGQEKKLWQANAWLLERRHPEKYGRRQLDVHNTGQQTIDVVVHQVPLPSEPPMLEGVVVPGTEGSTKGEQVVGKPNNPEPPDNGNGGGQVLLPDHVVGSEEEDEGG